MTVHSVSMPAMMKSITIRIRFSGVARARIRAAAWIFRFGGVISGCNVEIETEPANADVIRYQPLGGGPIRTAFGRRV